MTASELAKYFASRAYFVDPDQEVKFVLSPDDVPLEKGAVLEIRGSVVPESGKAVVAFRPAPVRKYRFSLRFEANPVIEARSLEEAERLAAALMNHRVVVDTCTGDGDGGYEAQEPCFMEEVKE